jgi:hypothetical protein
VPMLVTDEQRHLHRPAHAFSACARSLILLSSSTGIRRRTAAKYGAQLLYHRRRSRPTAMWVDPNRARIADAVRRRLMCLIPELLCKTSPWFSDQGYSSSLARDWRG